MLHGFQGCSLAHRSSQETNPGHLQVLRLNPQGSRFEHRKLVDLSRFFLGIGHGCASTCDECLRIYPSDVADVVAAVVAVVAAAVEMDILCLISSNLSVCPPQFRAVDGSSCVNIWTLDLM